MKHFTTLIMMVLISLTASANSFIGRFNTEPLKVDMPEWNYSLNSVTTPTPKMKLGDMPMNTSMKASNNVQATKETFKWMKTNPGTKPYKFMDDMTFVGVPLFVGGMILKSEKNAFRQNYNDEWHANTRLLTHFKSSIDDYSQYFGPAMTLGLKIFGYGEHHQVFRKGDAS